MKILLLGADGQLGRQLARSLPSRGQLIACGRRECNLGDDNSILNAIDRSQPDIIVNAAAYTAVDKAESERDIAFRINSRAVEVLANEANRRNVLLIHYSTDYVFDGTKSEAYSEEDPTNPLNVYGASKRAGEAAIASSTCQHFVFRTTWVIGRDSHNFAKTILKLAQERDSLSVVCDQYGVPTSPELIAKVTASAIDAISRAAAWPNGLYHLTPRGNTTWFGVAQTLLHLAEERGLKLRVGSSALRAISTAEYPTPAKRPHNSRLNTDKLERELDFGLPDWNDDFKKVADGIFEEIGLG